MLDRVLDCEVTCMCSSDWWNGCCFPSIGGARLRQQGDKVGLGVQVCGPRGLEL